MKLSPATDNDKTSTETLKAELDSISLFYQLNPSPVIRLDKHGKIILANAAAVNLLQIECGGRWPYFEPENDGQSGFTEENLPNIVSNNMQLAINSKIQGLWYKLAVCGVQQYGFMNIYAADITILIDAEKKAKRAQESAEASSSAKSLFLATMSHELRTPMNAIIGFTELALRSASDSPIEGNLQKISQASHTLLDLINNVLDYTKLESDKLELEEVEFSIEREAYGVYAMLAHAAAEKGLKFRIWIDPALPEKLLGDPLRFKQIFINLISNAIKFTSSGEVFIIFKLGESEKGSLRLFAQVVDSGIGISKENTTRIFDSFAQEDNQSARLYGGTGLGLSIVQNIVRLMGGDICIHSEKGIGSTFSVKLDFHHYSSQSILEIYRKKYRTIFTSRNISIISDDTELVNNFKKLFELLGAEVEITGGGSANISDQSRKKIDACVFDLSLMCKEEDENLASLLSGICPVLWLGCPGKKLSWKKSYSGDFELSPAFTQNDILCMLDRIFNKDRPAVTRNTVEEDFFTNKALNGLRVLVAEDDRFTQELDRQILTKMGLYCEIVGDGNQAINAWRKGDFDIVLMDMLMPGTDGYTAVRTIRQQSQSIPIVALTANALVDDKDKCLAAGASAYLSKPFKPHELGRLILDLIEAKK